jgi:hypothetical protein
MNSFEPADSYVREQPLITFSMLNPCQAPLNRNLTI